MVADLVQGATGSNPNHLFAFNDTLFFFADVAGDSQLLRLTRGSSSPVILTQLQANSCTAPVVLRGKLLLVGNFGMWTSNGTPGGTSRVETGVSSPCNLSVIGDTLYFTGSGANIWSSDGTAAGTRQFLAQSSVGATYGFGDGILYFNVEIVSAFGGVFRTDGTSTQQILFSHEPRANTPYNIVKLIGISNGHLIAHNTTVQPGITGTVRIDLSANTGLPNGNTHLGSARQEDPLLLTSSRVFFVGSSIAGDEPTVTDGTAGGTVMLRDFVPNGSPVVEWFGEYNGTYLIRLVDPVAGPQLWQTDGTPVGTQLIADIVAEPPNKFSPTAGLTYVPDHGGGGPDYFFVGRHDEFGNELYVYWNDAPIASADSGTAQNGNAIELQVLTNDRAREGALDPASVRIASAPAHGTATIQAQGSVTYTPNAGYSGSDSFTYTVADTQGRRAQPATVTLTITATPPSKSGGGALSAAAIFALLSVLAAARIRRSTQ
jgi:ELWxxDGT repeat protein